MMVFFLNLKSKWLNMIKYVTFYRHFVVRLTCHCRAVTYNINYSLRYSVVVDHKLFA